MSTGLHIAFRVDASISIGSGHVMRCLTLADALTAEGGRCHFLCRNLPGHMMDLITRCGHAVTALPAPTTDQVEKRLAAPIPPHASWLGVPLEDEILQSCEILNGLTPDRVVVDHYALDARWEAQAVPRGTPVMVIDDLADRTHLCDILLDQNLGREPADYDELVPLPCKRLIGPHFALLRPEFSILRDNAVARRKNARLQNVLITLGGIDKDNMTCTVLEAISDIHLPADLSITVVMGNDSPWLETVCNQARKMLPATRVLSGVSNMAKLMACADLCIGAAGSTSWERCAMGLPTLLLVLAENQWPTATALAEAGAAVLLGDVLVEEQRIILEEYLRSDAACIQLRNMSLAAADLVDGSGTGRNLAQILSHQDHLRPADRSDVEPIWEWRYSDHAERFYRTLEVPTLEAHTAWMERALSDPLRDLLIYCHAGEPVAHIRFDIDAENPGVAEIGICLSHAVRGQGIGQRALSLAIASPPPGVQRLNAEVHRDNVASARIFEKLGFCQVETDGEFLQMTLQVTNLGYPAAQQTTSEKRHPDDN